MLERYDESELLEFIEGGLEARRAEALSREIDDDPAAAALIERMRRDRVMVRSLGEPEAPDDLMQALEPLLARPMLLDGPLSKGIVESSSRRRRLWPRVAAIAALIAIALLAGVWAATTSWIWPGNRAPLPSEFALKDADQPVLSARRIPASEFNELARSKSHDQGVGSGKEEESAAASDRVWPPGDAEIHHHEADLKIADALVRRSAEPAAPSELVHKSIGKGGVGASGGFGGGGGGLAGARQGQVSQHAEAPNLVASQTIDDSHLGATDEGRDPAQTQTLVLDKSQDAQARERTPESWQFVAADFVVVVPATDPAAAEIAVCNAVNDLGGNVSLVRNFSLDEALEIEKQVQAQQMRSNQTAAPGVAGSRKVAAEIKDASQAPLSQQRLDELALNCQTWQATQAPAATGVASKLAEEPSSLNGAQIAGPVELMTPYVNQLQFSMQGASHTIAVPAPLLETVLEKLSTQPGQQTILRSMQIEDCETEPQPSLPPAWIWLRDRQLVNDSIQRLVRRAGNEVVLVPVVVESPAEGKLGASSPAAATRPTMQPAPAESSAPGQTEDP